MKNIVYAFVLLLLGCNTANDKNTDSSVKENKLDKKESPKVSTFLNPYENLSYSILSQRKSHVLKNDSIKKILDEHLDSNTFDINEFTDLVLNLTKDQLEFSFSKCKSVPDQLIKSKKANCIGYAAYFNSLMNYGLQKKGLTKNYTCKHYVGKIYFAGKNIHTLFNDPFFKDHDFNIITDLETGNRIGVDPSLFEYLKVRRVAIK